ncbi:hypothetical protein OG897_26980 [Streptomyces sp. NBC_00237]|uniref:hypothetical protein n=1 Tax=Streptomyces sp. NBC_00237 TaxID=2975687 RepID=UPI002259FE9A|nr:hypothetical protein [Streptomyces sp. NBC_00237]MCX5205087.1 hypothetical protein [Streptomyces sp. NBC_00237]
MGFQKGDHVTPRKPPAPGELRPFGRVTGWGACPFQGARLVMVRWPGTERDISHSPEELAHVD